MSEGTVIEFALPVDDGAPKLKATRRKQSWDTRHCQHHGSLVIDYKTQLVECEQCKLVMSAFNALSILAEKWERMHYDVTEWRKMNAARNVSNKEQSVRRAIRQLQWIGIPDESEPEARKYWHDLTEATGKEPYAMFRHGRGRRIQYCVLSPTGGWTDADFIIKCAEGQKAQALKLVSTACALEAPCPK